MYQTLPVPRLVACRFPPCSAPHLAPHLNLINFLKSELGDVVFVALPEEGLQLDMGGESGEVADKWQRFHTFSASAFLISFRGVWLC